MKKLKSSQPPKKRITNILDIKRILEYSPKKKRANIIPEYSTLYPATISASASGKSKGARLVSARIETKKIKDNGNKGKTNHTERWAYTISIKFKEPAHKITGIIIKPKETSYEIICAAVRTDPKNAYFELLDQPAMITV